MSKYYRTNEKHPTHRKVAELFNVMSDMGLTMEYEGYGRVRVHDKDRPGEKLQLADLEAVVGGYHDGICELPPVTEWKLVREGE